MNAANEINSQKCEEHSTQEASTLNPSSFLSVTVKSVMIIVLIAFISGAAQLMQYTHSLHDMRMGVISNWVKNNPEKSHLAARFVDECIIGLSASDSIKVHSLKSIYTCGDDFGLRDLSIEIKQQDALLNSAAWPLSIVADL